MCFKYEWRHRVTPAYETRPPFYNLTDEFITIPPCYCANLHYALARELGSLPTDRKLSIVMQLKRG
jgi:hypothetical protein